MRKHQQPLMIIITVLVIISFAYFFNRADMSKMGREDIGVIYGRKVTITEMQRVQRMVQLGYELGMNNLVSQDFASDASYGWNVLVLHREAQRMGLDPSDDEVSEAIQRVPRFQTNGKFDAVKFEEFTTRVLGSKGFGLRQVEEIVRLDLQLGRIRSMLEATATVGADEVRAAFEDAYAKNDVKVARLKLADFTAAVQVSDEDVKKEFEDPKKKDSYKQDAKRKVKYVKVELTEEEKKATGPARKDGLQRIANKAEQLADGMQESGADLTKVATGLGLAEQIKETAEFDRASINSLPEASLQGFTQAALALTNENKVSEVIQTPDAFYLVAVSAWTPERALTLEEAKPQIVKKIQQERARVALNAKMEEARGKVVEAMKAGKTFDEACTAAGLKAESFPLYSRSEPNFESSDASTVIQTATQLVDGQLSKPQETPDGSTLILLVRRLPADDKRFETMRDAMANNLKARRKSLALREWLRSARTAAGMNQTVDLRES
ncbi:MAG: SurA N-terminal domain-containing protein [Verrucomicrobia bacterium]|nr:SurA N-terminal domain-containing protein [Verrucomicrobiota bacterium]